MEAAPVIRVSGLRKSYGAVPALQGVGFAISRGEIFGYLGPNGAGKTTTIKILCGLLPREGGDVSICGADVAREPVWVKQRIGVVPDDSNLYPELTCRRNLEYLGELYGLPRRRRQERAGELLSYFALTDKGGAAFGTLSRGLKRRLTIAAALVHEPEVLFLDEPTAGLDVPSARSLRELIAAINRRGTTVFLTTHNLPEAEALCRTVLILVKGRVVARGPTREMAARVRRVKTLTVTFTGKISPERLRQACPAIGGVRPANGAWHLELTDTQEALEQMLAFARTAGVRVEDINASGGLEEAFLAVLQESQAAAGGGS